MIIFREIKFPVTSPCLDEELSSRLGKNKGSIPQIGSVIQSVWDKGDGCTQETQSCVSLIVQISVLAFVSTSPQSSLPRIGDAI